MSEIIFPRKSLKDCVQSYEFSLLIRLFELEKKISHPVEKDAGSIGKVSAELSHFFWSFIASWAIKFSCIKGKSCHKKERRRANEIRIFERLARLTQIQFMEVAFNPRVVRWMKEDGSEYLNTHHLITDSSKRI